MGWWDWDQGDGMVRMGTGWDKGDEIAKGTRRMR